MTEPPAVSGLDIRRNVPLASYTTIGIGGPARWFAGVSNEDALRNILRWAAAEKVSTYVLGGGSNTLFSDEGFDGLILHMELSGFHVRNSDGRTLVTVAAGEDWDRTVGATVERGLAGLECLSGIPGQVGACPIQNIGAYGQEVRETIISVRAFDRRLGEFVGISAADCAFGYRTSRFKTEDAGRFVIVSVTFSLVPNGQPAVRYADLQRYLEGRGTAKLNLRDVRDAVLTIRKQKAMVVDPEEPSSRSCGSFFTNPIITTTELEGVMESGRTGGCIKPEDIMPSFPAEDGEVKLSAAWLISHAGFERGLRHGNVGLSQKHVLAIVNYGNGTAVEVLELAEIIRAKVHEKFGVTLLPEPMMPR